MAIHQLIKLSSVMATMGPSSIMMPSKSRGHWAEPCLSPCVHQAWPIGGYGGEPTASGFQKHFLECGKELERMGRLDTDVRRQLFGVELTHPEALALRA